MLQSDLMRAQTLKKIANDPIATAKAVQLVYVSCKEEGITRVRKGKGFTYFFQGNKITDKEILQRIHSLVLPPAWEDVWICKIEEGHLQATGKDAMGRKQYRYHPSWSALRNKTKFTRLLELGKVLPVVREQVNKDLSLPGLPKEKVLALVISLMQRTGIRIGNEFYEKLYGSFGLTTLKDKHASFNGNTVKFCFRGKKGVEHTVTLKSKKLSRIVQQCRDIPGKELFQYVDEEGKRHAIESGMVNEYIKNIAGEEFTAKDLRTWCGSVVALTALKEVGEFENQKEAAHKIVEALNKVSEQLGNTRTVCKKYYVHPGLLELYEKGTLVKLMNDKNDLSGEELLIEILEKAS